jgi:thiamine biosynthesis lipoprotein
MPLELHRFPFFAMGSQCELQLYARDEEAVAHAAELAIAEVLRIEARYSRYLDDSIITAINRAAAQGTSLPIDEETASLLDYAYACHAKSGGLFDISSGVLRRAWDFTAEQLPEQRQLDILLPLVGLEKIHWDKPMLTFEVPGMELDFGGIAKEYAADQAAAVCIAQGIRHGLVELGGDIKVIGRHPDLAPWIVGIRHPRHPDEAMTTVELSQVAIASSGDYERYMEVDGIRYCHILDPHTGWPVRGLASVSIVTGQCLLAGSVATMAMLKGNAGKQWLTEMGVSHLWMDEAGNSGGNIHPE